MSTWNGRLWVAKRALALVVQVSQLRHNVVACQNCYQGLLSADALGIAACLYAYSHLGFTPNAALGRMYARHYHLLREYMMEHAEVGAILQAID